MHDLKSLKKEFKATGTINSNDVINASRDMYDFGEVVKEENYSPQLKKLIEKNRPKKERKPKSI